MEQDTEIGRVVALDEAHKVSGLHVVVSFPFLIDSST